MIKLLTSVLNTYAVFNFIYFKFQNLNFLFLKFFFLILNTSRYQTNHFFFNFFFYKKIWNNSNKFDLNFNYKFNLFKSQKKYQFLISKSTLDYFYNVNILNPLILFFKNNKNFLTKSNLFNTTFFKISQFLNLSFDFYKKNNFFNFFFIYCLNSYFSIFNLKNKFLFHSSLLKSLKSFNFNKSYSIRFLNKPSLLLFNKKI